MIYLKTNPVGIDKHIQFAQKYLYDKLSENYSCEIEAYGRVFKNDYDGSIKPIYYNNDGSYKEVLTDSKIKGLHFFFVEDDKSEIIKGTNKRLTNIDLIVVIDDFRKVKSDVKHYADENIVIDVMSYMKTHLRGSELTKNEEALSGFDISKLQFIYPFFVFKITGEINNY